MKADKGAKESPAERNRPTGPPKPVAGRRAPGKAEGSGIRSGEKIPALKALRESEEKMSSIFRAAPIGIGLVVDRVIRDVNQRFCDLVGYTREELINKSARMVYPSEEEYQYVGQEKYRQIAERGAGAVETRFRRKDGQVIDVWLSSAPLDPSDLSRGVTFTALDITERKQMAEKLQEQERRYRALFDRTNDGVFIISLEGIHQEVNQRAADMLAYRVDEIVGRPITEFIAPAEQQKGREKLAALLAGKQLPVYERLFRRKDGTEFLAEINAALAYDADGNPLHIHSVIRDITERKKAEQEILESRESFRVQTHRLSSLIANLLGGIIIETPERKVLQANRKFCDLFGINAPPESLAGADCRHAAQQVKHLFADDEGFITRIDEILAAGQPVLNEELTLCDGRVFERDYLPVEIGDGQVENLWYYREITERKRTEQTLKCKVEELASLSRAAQTVTASLDVEKVLSEIVVLARKVADSDHASVVQVDEEGRIIGRSAETLPGGPALEYRARGEGFTRWIIQTLRPVVVDDIGEDGVIRSAGEEGAPATVNPVLSACGIKSFVGLPLVFKGRLLGVLYLHSLRPHTFRDKLPILTAFASQAAVAIENADLYDAVRKELTERKGVEERLQSTISLLEATLNSTADGILVVDLEGKIQSFNEQFKNMWRIPHAILETREDDRALGFVLDQLKDPEQFLSKVRQLYGDVLAESYDTLEFKDGRIFERFSRPQFLGTAPVGRVWSFRDVTERARDEEKLRAALHEREVMLREIHHRVKNNIQIVSSLLRLQSRYVKDEKALEVLNESQNRIKSMALIHEKLYQSQDFSRIDFSDYVAKMITHLFAIYKVDFSRIRHNVEAKGIQLDINRAIPCGLIINELVTNALKHAFPENREGGVIVRMQPLDGDKFELSVKDDGVGIPEGFDPAEKGTLGFQIVGDLVRQLDGSIEIRRGAGTEIIVRF